MESFNYNHLYYFWSVARNGSVSRASAELRVSQPTVSEQIGKLEDALGVTLFERAGRGIQLSSSGQALFGYADQIFRLGQQMLEVVQNGASSNTPLRVGIDYSIPNLVAFKLLDPVVRGKNVQLSCYQDRVETLLGKLVLRQLDVVLSDSAPSSSTTNMRVFNHKLGSSGFSFLASPKLRPRGKFPQVLEGVPLLMPEANSRMHTLLQQWLEKSGVRPKIAGEFSHSALLEVFAESGAGVCVSPTIIERELRGRFKFAALGRTTAVRQEFYAVTTERHPANAAVQALLVVKPKRV